MMYNYYYCTLHGRDQRLKYTFVLLLTIIKQKYTLTFDLANAEHNKLLYSALARSKVEVYFYFIIVLCMGEIKG